MFGNRHRLEEEVKKKIPDARVKHECACLLTTVIRVDGKAGKRDVCPIMFFLPTCCSRKCCSSEKYGTPEYLPPATQQGGSPDTVSMER